MKTHVHQLCTALLSFVAGDGVLLVRHPFDPIHSGTIRARGFASWAESATLRMYIYSYRPGAGPAAVAHPPPLPELFARAASAGLSLVLSEGIEARI